MANCDLSGQPFERYRELLDDPERFAAAVREPLPVTIWANTERIAADELAGILTEEGFSPAPIPWYPGGFRLPASQRLGKHWGFFAGLYQIQEEAAMLPAMLLDAQPGESVLDLCAAPGGKTTQIALSMRNRGTLIANELNRKRLGALGQTCDRLGVRNVSIWQRDGVSLPRNAGFFDRILVDAPCSCEGTSRKNARIKLQADPAYSRKRRGAQLGLLLKAAQLCRVGGRIVYATCTYAPEENELLVAEVLEGYGADCLRILPVRVPGLNTSPGLTEWEDASLPGDLRNCLRVWPHQNNTGGFFVAVLEKVSERERKVAVEAGPRDALEAVPGTWKEDVQDRYGLPEDLLENLVFTLSGVDHIAAVAADHAPPGVVQREKVGGRFLHRSGAVLRLTHPGALLVGGHATRNVIDLGPQQLEAFLARRASPMPTHQLKTCDPVGHVVVRYKGKAVGIGRLLVDDRTGDTVLRSHFPKTWSRYAAS